jgi:hypothetical protein
MRRTKTPAPPASLHDRLIAQENERHKGRLAEIKRAEAMLRLFEPNETALKARGIHFSLDRLYINYTRALQVTAGGISAWDNRIYDGLLDLGFEEIKRDVTSSYAHCILKKGRLQVYLMIDAAHQHTKPEAK